MQAEINELKALENAVNAENSKVIAEMKTDYAKELDDLKASAYQVQTAYDAKCSECEEARSQLKEVNEARSQLRQSSARGTTGEADSKGGTATSIRWRRGTSRTGA